MPAGDAHQLPEPAIGGRVGHLAQAEVDAFGQEHAEQANAVPARRARAQVREGVREPSGIVDLEQDVGDARGGQAMVEIEDNFVGTLRDLRLGPLDAQHTVLDDAPGDRFVARRSAQPAQPVVERSSAVREPFVGVGRNRRAAGIGDRAGRHKRLPDVPVAARARQPDVAGTERVAQVE